MYQQTRNNPELLLTFKSILQQQYVGSQTELAHALSLKGFDNISQAKISRMLSRVGAVRTRNSRNEMVYHLPDETIAPRTKQAIHSMVLDVKHNNMQIIIKTIIGGATIISRILETLGESFGILGCISDENTILVIPTDIEKIEHLSQKIIKHLEVTKV